MDKVWAIFRETINKDGTTVTSKLGGLLHNKESAFSACLEELKAEAKSLNEEFDISMYSVYDSSTRFHIYKKFDDIYTGYEMPVLTLDEYFDTLYKD